MRRAPGLTALRAGARAHLTKDADRRHIARTLQSAADGLTAREAEILTLMARGSSNSAIARSVFLSANTVKTHIDRIFARTRSRGRAAAAAAAHYARWRGLDQCSG